MLISPNRSPAEARTIKPTVTTGLIPTFETNIPQSIDARKHHAPRGTIDIPLKNDVYPSKDCSIDGNIEADDIMTPIKTI